MSRTFFSTVADALWGFLPPELQGYQQQHAAHNLKIWYGSVHEHYEVQRVSRAVLRATGERTGDGALEVGFHAEHPVTPVNEDVVTLLTAKEETWRRALGKEPFLGGFVGRPEIRDRWRRISELWIDISLDEDGAAIEAAERLADYIRAIEPIIVRAPDPRCRCRKA